MYEQTITRMGTFDSAHRVMHQTSACRFLHGHTYRYELTFKFSPYSKLGLGYAIDFKEIKRVAGQFIEDYFDHGAILNPADTDLINMCVKLDSKHWTMGINNLDFCNPTAENISRELFIACDAVMQNFCNVKLETVRLYETPNCFVDCNRETILPPEVKNFHNIYGQLVTDYAKSLGVVEYDSRNLTK